MPSTLAKLYTEIRVCARFIAMPAPSSKPPISRQSYAVFSPMCWECWPVRAGTACCNYAPPLAVVKPIPCSRSITWHARAICSAICPT